MKPRTKREVALALEVYERGVLAGRREMRKESMGKAQKDVFMNIAAFAGQFAAADSSIMRQTVYETGLGIRLNMAWQIHFVEMYCPTVWGDAGVDIQQLSLSSIGHPANGTAAYVYSYSDARCLFAHEWVSMTVQGNELRADYLPPILFAGKKLYLQMRTIAGDVAALRGQFMGVRIGFTTLAIEDRDYMELAETWERVG